MRIAIFGAGLSGLIAARVLAARGFAVEIFEAQPSLPHNHGALLRFRSSAVADATGIPFREVRVHKALYRDGALHTTATLADHNRYALRVVGAAVPRSILSLDPVTRYIAPVDFIEQLGSTASIHYGVEISRSYLSALAGFDAYISTIPMPAMRRIFGLDSREDQFHARPIWSLTIPLRDVDVFQTIYYIEDDTPLYRASISGDRLVLEMLEGWRSPAVMALETLFHFGISDDKIDLYPHEYPDAKHHPYGKLLPSPDDEARRAFITWLSDAHQIYSLGRFATWRQILLDDLVQDLDRIIAFFRARSTYDRRILSARHS